MRAGEAGRLAMWMAIVFPLSMIALAIVLSPWFSFVDNALSDLGHAVDSDVAPIFNLGLATGGFILGLVSLCLLGGVPRAYRALLGFAGYDLMLIGVFDEVYGRLHFYVSVLFFAALLLLLIIYSYRERRPVYGVLAAVNIILWGLHFAEDVPPGAAIPELVSIASVIPVYYRITSKHLVKKG